MDASRTFGLERRHAHDRPAGPAQNPQRRPGRRGLSPPDAKTGVEIELLLPEGMGRLDLLDRLAARFGGRVEPFLFPSKVPVPAAPAAAATIALIEDVARHHQATVVSVSPDYRFFYLAHRAGRLLSDEGRLELSVVHDNTIAGGERVAELVTRPFFREDLPWLEEVVRFIGAIEGVSLPSNAALHVHADGAELQDARRLARLVELYEAEEAALVAFCETPASFRRAARLPADLLPALRQAESWDHAQAVLRALVPHRGFALNLFNLAAGDASKLTVELKLAAATLDPARVRALRERFVELVLRAR